MEYNAAQWGAQENVALSDFPGRKFLPDTLRSIRQVKLVAARIDENAA
jgi:hypothetical protein